jgi:hypothetical protein
MTDDEAWRAEERFWTGGTEHHREALDPECVMAFPFPAGIIAGAGIAESLAGAPRWSSVEMAERRVSRSAADLLVLAYKARGVRDGAAPYEAYCTSTYRRDGDRWRLVQHQQTPV